MSIQVNPGIVIGSGGPGTFPVEIFTGTTKSLVVADNLKFHVMNNTLPMTVIIPENAAEAFPIGAEMEFLREGTGTLTFVIAGAAVLDARDGLVALNAQYSAGTLKKTDTDEWGLIGDLSPGVFSPASLANLLAWHDASDLTSLLQADNPGFVSTWQDKSGNGNDLVQAVTAAQPTTGVDTINGLNAVEFDGVDDVLTKAGLTVSPSITILMAVHIGLSIANAGDSILAFDNGFADDFQIDAADTQGFLARFASSGLGATTPPLTLMNIQTLPVLLVYRLSAGDMTVNLRIDSVEQATDTYNGALNGVIDYHIAENRGNNLWLPVSAGEIIIYDRDLDPSEISALENPLKPKWGIA